MDATPDALAELKGFGVSAYGARAYLALLELGVADARAVSELASIPSAKIYGALVQLERRGLVEVTPGKPRKYAAVPIAAFLERQVTEQEARIEELRARTREIVELFPQGPGISLAERPQTVTVEGKRNVMQHLREACQRAESSIYTAISPLLRGDLPLRRPFEEAAKRGVDVRFVEDDLPPAVANAESAASLLATFDGRTALLARLRRAPRKEGHRSGAILTTDPGFVGPLHRLLVFRREHTRSPAGTEPFAARDARIDARTFDRLVQEHTRQRPREVCAVLHAAEAGALERDRLWRAAKMAARMRIILSPPAPGPFDHALVTLLPPEAEVKFLPRASAVAYAIIDGQRAFLVSPSRGTRDGAEEPTFAFTADAAIVRAFESQFEANWAMATPLPRPRI